MKFFVDSANLDEIRRCVEWGILDGVTTNPSLVSKEKVNFHERVKEICNLVNGPVSAEVTTDKFDEMLLQGRQLAKLHDNVVVKVPLTEDGIRACKTLSGEGIKVNVTLCFSVSQALLAAKAGATFVSPFLGRLDDISHDGMQLIRDIMQVYRNYDFSTEVLAASLRHPLHVVDAAKAGADIATLPFAVMEKLFRHPLTDLGQEKFLSDYEKVKETGR